LELLDDNDGSVISGVMTGGDGTDGVGTNDADDEIWTFSDEIYIEAGSSRTFTVRGDVPADIGTTDQYRFNIQSFSFVTDVLPVVCATFSAEPHHRPDAYNDAHHKQDDEHEHEPHDPSVQVAEVRVCVPELKDACPWFLNNALVDMSLTEPMMLGVVRVPHGVPNTPDHTESKQCSQQSYHVQRGVECLGSLPLSLDQDQSDHHYRYDCGHH